MRPVSQSNSGSSMSIKSSINLILLKFSGAFLLSGGTWVTIDKGRKIPKVDT